MITITERNRLGQPGHRPGTITRKQMHEVYPPRKPTIYKRPSGHRSPKKYYGDSVISVTIPRPETKISTKRLETLVAYEKAIGTRLYIKQSLRVVIGAWLKLTSEKQTPGVDRVSSDTSWLLQNGFLTCHGRYCMKLKVQR